MVTAAATTDQHCAPNRSSSTTGSLLPLDFIFSTAAALPMTTMANTTIPSRNSLSHPASPENDSSSSKPEHIQELFQPAPISMTLVAALQLLTSPLVPPHDVYLMTEEYLQNWLVWAFNQSAIEAEESRIKEAIRLAAIRHRLERPAMSMEYTVPGPIDSSALSMEGHPLLLRPNVAVRVRESGSLSTMDSTPTALRRVKSLPDNGEHHLSDKFKSMSIAPDDGTLYCCAVPEKFYETLRSVHGVLCDDCFTVRFQPFETGYSNLVHHHEMRTNSTTVDTNSGTARPVEFRRKVVLLPPPPIYSEPKSLMDKLLREEQQLQPARMIPTVEVHPIKMFYKVVSHEKDIIEDDGFVLFSRDAVVNMEEVHNDGFVLASRDTMVSNVLQSIKKVAAPQKASSCVRFWTKRSLPHLSRYEVVRQEELQALHNLSNNKTEKEEEKEAPENDVVMADWLRLHSSESSFDMRVLVETTKTMKSTWPLAKLELENRIKPGDFVDAQDSSGKWYEAVVKEVTEEAVSVHYLGWASKWDSWVRRRKGEEKIEGVVQRAGCPAPLWSRSSRWRETATEGQTVEVRDSSSIASRPRWYRGKIVKIAKDNEPIQSLNCGAQLEVYDLGDGRKAPILLLKQTKQVLVEVPEERNRRAQSASLPGVTGKDTQEPSLRWVYLYGEELCKIGTHLKQTQKGPATLTYEFDANRAPVEIMKSFNNIHGAGFVRESLRGVPPAPGSVGLHNLGNSCFLNSIVQCLNHVKPLTQFFLEDRHIKDLSRENPLGSGGQVALAYASLQKKMWGGDYSVLVPRMLKQTVANFVPQFKNSYQHDSHEFCQFLMDGLHEDLNRRKKKPYVEELEGFGLRDDMAAIESWRRHLLRHDSVIVDYCQGMHRSHLTCPVCGRESIKFDVYSSVSLPLAQTKAEEHTTLEDCLEKFMEGEQLDEVNAWYCPNCKKHVCALKMIALWSVPDILILHLKRFTFNTCQQSGGVLRSKIDYEVDFPIEKLDLTKYVLGPYDENAPPIYQLFGVSEHVGKTANSGHYTATVRNSVDDKWYRCNDSHIGRTSGEASITGGAYLLFYKRARGTSKWGGLEKEMLDKGIDPYGGGEIDKEGFTKVKSKKNKRKQKT